MPAIERRLCSPQPGTTLTGPHRRGRTFEQERVSKMLTRKPAISPIRVLVVDDSSFMRSAITRHIQREARFQVIGAATNGREGVAKALELRPDVITMDVEMPEMNGIEALRQILAQTSIPVIMVSAQTEAGAKTTIQALQYGAMDFIPKKGGFENLHEKLFAVVGAARARLAPTVAVAAPRAPLAARKPRVGQLRPRIVVIGSSTGGPRALLQVLERLPAHFPAPIVVAQHMPPQFTSAMSKWLAEHCALKIVEASDEMALAPGGVYVGPGGMQFRVASGRTKISADQGESLYKPSVDVLADSVAAGYGGNVLAIMLTGMGNDGARGFLKLKEAGAHVIAQDQASSAVWGMPRAVAECGGADEILAVGDIGRRINALVGLSA
ncbi:chemotaxis response regulator protein-glutamate methylesterase [Rhodoblastus acidophilus]|uniref:Protein-glutamate methylesterase/protein-glutamine glutaminase n=1 Tax=Candidatus Rhodoblastus alkanivorans TaxID=2954117 RepID=A0ABS9Z3K3_9HYPH|nr:chemotaxis response regulator protein-glutamate methylesterase [Candidatus Rhodoblastus alkanivorans]MCI4678814.1 chemotaxis response regulator protein-glutamate methylesterase [Candidatus Rhodoblastus alkanivorans]MCI4682203.1 chemotaxis response regulator protein-glutamate methylesterase [Candidatus Rhodoblastus alkanivorans]MDI4639505.1 chemotaxis response regulator protein-glutamate methylesterase [Rhodoblastus acidophilus]